MKVTFWGTRGSIATPGASTIRYGGNTSCTQLVSDAGTLIVLDAGTGARVLGDHLVRSRPHGLRGAIFLTHTHWDHIQGFPFFAPIFVEGNEWRVYGPSDGESQLEEALAGQMQHTYFPVEMAQLPAGLSCINLGEGVFTVDDIQVHAQYLNHPAVTLGYRLSGDGATVVYCTDHEPFGPTLFRDSAQKSLAGIVHPGDAHHAAFLAGADLVIHDAQYTSAEYERKRTWGHSYVDYVVDLAMVAGVKRLALYHHDPTHDDARLDEISAYARDRVAYAGGKLDVFCAYEGQVVEVSRAESDSRDEPDSGFFSPNGSRARILVADDDAMILALIQDILEEDRYVVEAARTGTDTLDAVERSRPDLVLLDIRLPGIDGFRVLEQLRRSDAGRDVPIIVLTGITETEYIDRGFQLGATDYMTKPFSPPQLRARVSAWLRRSAHETLQAP
jgi:CheY-like chemotaxis protein/phosphoribosyl 1,2-cyclic phosphodiesterase